MHLHFLSIDFSEIFQRWRFEFLNTPTNYCGFYPDDQFLGVNYDHILVKTFDPKILSRHFQSG